MSPYTLRAMADRMATESSLARAKAVRWAADEIDRLSQNVSTLEVSRIKKAFPLYDERMIYDVAVQLIGIRMGIENG